jgi:hypothetical protein
VDGGTGAADETTGGGTVTGFGSSVPHPAVTSRTSPMAPVATLRFMFACDMPCLHEREWSLTGSGARTDGRPPFGS